MQKILVLKLRLFAVAVISDSKSFPDSIWVAYTPQNTYWHMHIRKNQNPDIFRLCPTHYTSAYPRLFPSLENNTEDISPAFEKKPLPHRQPMVLNDTALTSFLLSLFRLCDFYENKPRYTFLCPHLRPGKKISDETDPVRKFPGTSHCDKKQPDSY